MWTIVNYDIRFLYKMLKSRVKKDGSSIDIPRLFKNLIIPIRSLHTDGMGNILDPPSAEFYKGKLYDF